MSGMTNKKHLRSAFISTSYKSYQGYRIAFFFLRKRKNRRHHIFSLLADICSSLVYYVRLAFVSSEKEEEKNANHVFVYAQTGTFDLLMSHSVFSYLATITSWYTGNTAWTDSTRLTRKTILTINRQCTIITLNIF
jgi:hypothetical protein